MAKTKQLMLSIAYNNKDLTNVVTIIILIKMVLPIRELRHECILNYLIAFWAYFYVVLVNTAAFMPGKSCFFCRFEGVRYDGYCC